MRPIKRLLQALPFVFGAGLAAAQQLPALNIPIAETSVSGISSGGFMAVQFQIAHSSIVKGAGVVAAGPWSCSRGDSITATTKCSCTLEPASVTCQVSPTSTDVENLVKLTAAADNAKLVDPVANVAKQKVLTFAGDADKTVPKTVVAQLGDYYRKLGLPPANLQEVLDPKAGHTMPTLDYGNACGITAEPYIGKCKEDMAGRILKQIYGNLNAPTSGKAKGKFVQFDQRPYTPTTSFLWTVSLDSGGWLYLPDACAKGQSCRLHIALHGCKQGQSYLPLHPVPGGGLYYGTTFVKNTGYDRWADANNLVILFPQATSAWNNPNGCWDWWGYTDRNYANKQGVQIRFLRNMVDRLTSGVKP